MFKSLHNDYLALDPDGPGDMIFNRISKITKEILAQYPDYSNPEIEALMIGAINYECAVSRIVYGTKKKAQEREADRARIAAKIDSLSGPGVVNSQQP
jgi:hypothetical protein